MKRFYSTIFILVLFVQFMPSVLAGGASAGVYETDVRDKYLSSGEEAQLLMSFTVEPWESIPGDLTVDSLDITCAPSYGFTDLRLMQGDLELDSTTFVNSEMGGNQKAHFDANDYILPNGDATELSLLVTVEEGTGDYITACSIDDLFLRNTSTKLSFSSESQAEDFSVDRLVYVDDPFLDDRVDKFNIFDDKLRPSNLGLETKDNLLMEFAVNVSIDTKLEDLFILCDGGNIIEKYRLEVGGASYEYVAMQNNAYTNSRPEHSFMDRIVFGDLGVNTGYGVGVNFKLYGDTYDYFSSMEDAEMACSVLDIRATNVFSDVNGNTDYVDSIDWMHRNGIINGYGDETFGPDNCVLRGELLKMVYLTLGVNLDDLSAGGGWYGYFSDVDEDAWYWPYLRYALEVETVKGYSNKTFGPGQCVSRVEAIKIAILEFNDGEIPGQYGVYGNPFDIASIDDSTSQWWWDYFISAMGSGSIGTNHFERYDADWTGLGVDSDFANPTYDFGPDESMTRKEVAEMLYRMKAMKDNGVDSFGDNDGPIAPFSFN